MSEGLREQLPTLGWIVVVLLIASLASPLARAIGKRLGRSFADLPVIVERARRALTALLAIAGVKIVLAATGAGNQAWLPVAQHGLTIAFIAAVVWFLRDLAVAIEGLVLRRYAASPTGDDVQNRRARTQISLLRRLVVAALTTIGIALILLTFPGVQAIGAGILASAGLLSIVAALAAQTSLTNVFAGVQLAFSDSLRVGDVIAVDGQAGRVDDVTLTNVVVDLWDGRRRIFPSSYFISRPFENWTRDRDRVAGAVDFDLTWSAPLDEMRAELDRVLTASPLWDQRQAGLKVADATNGVIGVRIDLTAADAETLFALQAAVREAMVRYLVQHGPDGVPGAKA